MVLVLLSNAGVLRRSVVSHRQSRLEISQSPAIKDAGALRPRRAQDDVGVLLGDILRGRRVRMVETYKCSNKECRASTEDIPELRTVRDVATGKRICSICGAELVQAKTIAVAGLRPNYRPAPAEKRPKGKRVRRRLKTRR